MVSCESLDGTCRLIQVADRLHRKASRNTLFERLIFSVELA